MHGSALYFNSDCLHSHILHFQLGIGGRSSDSKLSIEVRGNRGLGTLDRYGCADQRLIIGSGKDHTRHLDLGEKSYADDQT